MRVLLSIIILASVLVQAARPAVQPQVPPLKGGWQENGSLAISFAAARGRMRTRFEGQDFLLKHEIELGKRHDRCLMLWEKDGKRVIVMLWRINVGQTGYSIGEIKNGRK